MPQFLVKNHTQPKHQISRRVVVVVSTRKCNAKSGVKLGLTIVLQQTFKVDAKIHEIDSMLSYLACFLHYV